MQSPFTWAGIAAAAVALSSIPWSVWMLLVAAALATAMTSMVLDYRLRLRAIEKVPPKQVVDVLNAAPLHRHDRRGPR